MGRHPPEAPGSGLLHAHTLDWDMDRKVSDTESVLLTASRILGIKIRKIVDMFGQMMTEALKVHTVIIIKSQYITPTKKFPL